MDNTQKINICRRSIVVSKGLLLVICLLLFVFCQNVIAQTNDSIVRPRVGVVLSGGGARALPLRPNVCVIFLR